MMQIHGMLFFPYDRQAATAYARRWALSRNPAYGDFQEIGGDCTNFASQCLYAGTGVMNYMPTFGWFYLDMKRRAPAWTSVSALYRFLTQNTGTGPFGHEVGMQEATSGDLVQLALAKPDFQHTPVILSVGANPSPGNILVAAHTYDSLDRPLSTYHYHKIRFIRIDGFRR